MAKSGAIAAAVLLALAFPAGALAGGEVALGDLSSDRALQLRCTMLAGVIVSEHARGAVADNHGLSEADVGRMGEALAAALAADHGIDADRTRALLREDFEYFSKMQASDPPDEAARVRGELAGTCRPIWTGEQAIAPAPRTAAVPPPEATPPFCFALLARFAEAIRSRAKRDVPESMAFARQANRIEAQWLAGGGDAAVLATTLDSFDVAAFDALAEPDAETIIIKCQTMAGPDT